MFTAVRIFVAALAVLTIFGLVLTANADPFADVTVSLPPEGVGDIFSPGTVAVESLNINAKIEWEKQEQGQEQQES